MGKTPIGPVKTRPSGDPQVHRFYNAMIPG